jgi:hypothetical protein
MQYGRKVKHSATECLENESPLKEIHVDHVLRDVAEQHTTASRHGLPQADFHRTHRSSPSLLTDRLTLNFIQINHKCGKYA